ncbi:hypothetical protein GE09DRAFT_395912 [Coniochaeta sp. 2T2.1]|nr:hypothetical protein GE09DRAFT_395912 [Coniochaeta sp. 2T2.1]
MGAKVTQLLVVSLPAVRGLILISPAPPTPLALPPEMREQQMHAYDDADSAQFVAKNVLTFTFRSRELPGFVVDDMLRGNRWAREAWPAYAIVRILARWSGRLTFLLWFWQRNMMSSSPWKECGWRFVTGSKGRGWKSYLVLATFHPLMPPKP